MIESITLSGVASYTGPATTLNNLSQINFVYGSNGSGKTTISRVIADQAGHPACTIAWKAGTPLQAMVYNRDFVERNFNQSTELKGVFTLGENQTETLNKIKAAKADLDDLKEKIEKLSNTLQGDDGLSGKKGELSVLENALKEKCWTQKQKHDAKLQGAFEGCRGSAEKFKARVLQELANNSSTVLPLVDLEKKCASVFGTTPTTEPAIPAIDATKLIAHETHPILKKRVIGKEDVDIAAMIKKLGNSDWVRQGRTYFDINEGACPFCQQSTNEAFAKSLEEYFDETFVTDTKAIDDLSSNYRTDAERLQYQIDGIIVAPSRFIDVDKLKSEKQLLDSKITINIQRLAEKRKEANQIVELESLSNVIDEIKSLIDAANVEVSGHNTMVNNLAQERRTLTSQVWKFVLEELKADLDEYQKKTEATKKAVKALEEQIASNNNSKVQKEADIRALEKETTSVQPTIDAINALLRSFGFNGFSLAKAAKGTSYRLVRADGSDAKSTLSEGEKSFVTFLYFYHLLKGSDSESGMTTDRIVVIDDPVSSLDSDILFIVGSLIKGLFDEVRSGAGHIKQIFVLTHNVYFHKEVAFNPNRTGKAMNEETFWVVRKADLVSRVERHDSNPIKTSYELLWAEVRRQDKSKLTIQNTLRRILENYFKILGGVDPDKLCAMFEGKKKLICKSLFSWVNDGSHFAHDDLYIAIDDATVDNYLNVFREIFEKAEHLAHYKMMMGDAYEDEVVGQAEEATQ
ncbi:AAA family ATPase [Billgrantia desiderata]|uniref:AAA family ATPase n=1 Tax=Billgrantia desiderata TaxID=52021 RepID=UPI003F335F9C